MAHRAPKHEQQHEQQHEHQHESMHEQQRELLALIGLGANIGDPAAQVRAAAERLAALASDPTALRLSSLWRSAPVDCPPGSPDFVNAVAAFPVAVDTDPQQLLQALLDIEAAAGRQRSIANAPRRLDLDLLLLGERICDTATLTLPHPRGHQRAFVLLPAAEIVPELVWPGTGRTVAALRDALGPVSGLERILEGIQAAGS